MKASDFPFDLGSYDPDRYYTHSTDRKGHDKVVKVHVPPEIARCLQVIVESKIWPAYRTMGDFVRDAIYHHLARRLREVENPPMGSDAFWYALKEQELRDLEKRRETAQQLAETTERTVRRLLAEGQVAEAVEIVADVLYTAEQAEDRKEATWLKQAVRSKLADVWERLGLE